MSFNRTDKHSRAIPTNHQYLGNLPEALVVPVREKRTDLDVT
jgi:hypothetical protein